MTIPPQQTLFPGETPAQPARQRQIKTARSGTFTDNMKLPIHRWFRYSAGFSAEWAEQLIRDNGGLQVLDPFAGSGTTLLAAEAAGVKSYGFESHPFVARIASAKCQWDCDIDELKRCASELLSEAQSSNLAPQENTADLLHKCYTPEALYRLHSLRAAYERNSQQYNSRIRSLLWLAITAILRQCSHVGTAQWQYVLPNKQKSKTVDPYVAFAEKISTFCQDIDIAKQRGQRNTSTIIEHDARRTSPDITPNSIDFVLTSPPYPNNYDYADATRLEMTFWGEIRGWSDLQKSVRQFIMRSCSQHSAAEKLKLDALLEDAMLAPIRDEITRVCRSLEQVRQEKGGKKTYHTMVAAYFLDIAQVFNTLHVSCKKDATACFIIGDSAPYGVYVPVDEWMGKLAVSAGFSSFHFEQLRDRNTKWKNRKHTVPLKEGRLWIKG